MTTIKSTIETRRNKFCRLNNMVLKSQWATDEIKEEIKKLFILFCIHSNTDLHKTINISNIQSNLPL